jgi:hypothetical protein
MNPDEAAESAVKQKFVSRQGVPHSAAADDQRFGPFGCGLVWENSFI